MSIEAVKKLAESWLAEAKSLDENAAITQQWSGVPLTPKVIANRKTVARQFMEQANAVLAALGEAEPSASPIDEKPIGERLHEALVNVGMSHTPAYLHGYKATHENERFMLKQAASEFAAPYIARIAELEASVRTENEFYKQSVHREGELRGMLETVLARERDRVTDLEKKLAEVAMPEPSASPNHEFVFGSVQSMRIRVWNEMSRAVCIVDLDGVANPARYISAFVAGLSPLGDIPEARSVGSQSETGESDQ